MDLSRCVPPPQGSGLRTLIVGAGRSGRGLHLRGLERARATCSEPLFAEQRPLAVDPSPLARELASEQYGADVREALHTVDHLDPDLTVVHVCTPPVGRAAVLSTLGERGYRKVLVEKPLATSLHELQEIEKLAAAWDLRLGVVSPWLASSLTYRLQELLGDGVVGQVRRLAMYQHKPRFTRTLDGVLHPTAFDVEVPHAVSLALVLCGSKAIVTDAACHDMVIDAIVVPHLGCARLHLEHATGVVTDIHSDLTAPIRRRTVRVEGDEGALTAYYSIDSDDHYVQLARASHAVRHAREVFYDEPFPRMLIEWYRGFAGTAPMPVSDFAFNRRVVEILSAAKLLAGIVTGERLAVEEAMQR
ncbi:MAG TPA: Gfo/Idh/MocA family oxidoreductase [Solirubrobacteraceae bacterium]|nr:Gfo/Idh/MocA family oxidoreductase [Solirubrobacteraceae bacterium]